MVCCQVQQHFNTLAEEIVLCGLSFLTLITTHQQIYATEHVRHSHQVIGVILPQKVQ